MHFLFWQPGQVVSQYALHPLRKYFRNFQRISRQAWKLLICKLNNKFSRLNYNQNYGHFKCEYFPSSCFLHRFPSFTRIRWNSVKILLFYNMLFLQTCRLNKMFICNICICMLTLSLVCDYTYHFCSIAVFIAAIRVWENKIVFCFVHTVSRFSKS